MCTPLSQFVLIGCLELIHLLLPLLHVVPAHMARKVDLMQVIYGESCATLLVVPILPLIASIDMGRTMHECCLPPLPRSAKILARTGCSNMGPCRCTHKAGLMQAGLQTTGVIAAELTGWLCCECCSVDLK